MIGRFVAFEGGDACGKTTQAGLLATKWRAVTTREPGGTMLGENLRQLLLDKNQDIDDRAEALVFAAARAQHVADIIRPTLDEGTDVVCDRFIGSSLAYQGYGRGLDLADIRAISNFATGGLWPDLNVLIDIPVAVAMERKDEPPDRFESLDIEFKERLRNGYLDLANQDPGTWAVVDGTGSIEEVAALVNAAVDATFG